MSLDRVLARLFPRPRRKQFLDAGLGQRRYIPFVVLGRSRVGSNLLRSLLNAHPRVVAYGEVFQDAASLEWDHTGYFRTASTAARLTQDPAGFIDRHVFGRYPPGVRAVGFKLFYYHARTGAAAAVWPYLLARPELRVIHIRRRNLLQTHLSRKRASLTNAWVNTSGTREPAGPVELDYQECLDDFNRTSAWEEDADRQFAAHRKLDVYYEGLAGDYRAEALRIQNFLGLAPRPVAPSTFQQARQPLREAIANYADLRARFTGTPWEAFFTD